MYPVHLSLPLYPSGSVATARAPARGRRSSPDMPTAEQRLRGRMHSCVEQCVVAGSDPPPPPAPPPPPGGWHFHPPPAHTPSERSYTEPYSIPQDDSWSTRFILITPILNTFFCCYERLQLLCLWNPTPPLYPFAILLSPRYADFHRRFEARTGHLGPDMLTLEKSVFVMRTPLFIKVPPPPADRRHTLSGPP